MATQKPKPQRNFWDDPLERSFETGKQAVKDTAENVNYAFNPFATSPWEKAAKSPQTQQEAQKQMLEQQQKGPNNTPLDFDKLENKYKDQDMAQHEMLLKQFHKQLKNAEVQAWEETKHEKLQKERDEEEEKQRKLQEEQQRKEEDFAPPASVQKGPRGPGGKKKKANPMEDIAGANRH